MITISEDIIPILDPHGYFKNNTRQGILKRMAVAYSDRTGRGHLIMYEIVQMLIARQGHEPLKKAWGKDYDLNIQKLRKLGRIVANLNFFLLKLEDKKVLSEINVTSKSFIRYRRFFAESSEYMELLYNVFYTLMDATTVLQHLDIDNEYWVREDKK